jgi:uncharacterized membrane protein YfhO
MLEARIPAGVHTVEVSYWPERFTVGIVLALVAVAGILASVVMAWLARRRPGVPFPCGVNLGDRS